MNRNNLVPISPNKFQDSETSKLYEFRHSGKTPNGCWFIAPKFVEIVDIIIATGEYVYGETFEFECVQAY